MNNTNRIRHRSIQREAHPFCFICSHSNPFGLALDFKVNEDGSVTASFLAHPALEGFPGWLHGGVIASLLDGAMTNCLFARGLVAVTGELTTRYRRPVEIGCETTIRAWLEDSCSPLHLMRAELSQRGRLSASASAKFMERQA